MFGQHERRCRTPHSALEAVQRSTGESGTLRWRGVAHSCPVLTHHRVVEPADTPLTGAGYVAQLVHDARRVEDCLGHEQIGAEHDCPVCSVRTERGGHKLAPRTDRVVADSAIAVIQDQGEPSEDVPNQKHVGPGRRHLMGEVEGPWPGVVEANRPGRDGHRITPTRR
jgi:hypothetical protein